MEWSDFWHPDVNSGKLEAILVVFRGGMVKNGQYLEKEFMNRADFFQDGCTVKE